MENEKYFYTTSEKKEGESKIYHVNFDDRHFGDVEVPIDTLALVGELNEWWDKICAEI